MKNQFEEQYTSNRDAAFLEACQEEFKVKPFHAQWRSTYLIIQPIRYILQFASISTATAAAVFFVYIFTGSVLWGFVVGGSFMLLLEVLKSTAWGTFWKTALQFSKINGIAFGFAVLAALLSGLLSFFGAPRFVNQFSPSANLVSIDSLKEVKRLGEDSIKIHFNALADTLESTADKVHGQNSWKGKTTREARGQVVALRSASAATKSDSLSNAVNRYAGMMMAEVNEAKLYNDTSTAARRDRIAMVGGLLAWLTILIEVLVSLGIWWNKYYKYRAYDYAKKNQPTPPKNDPAKPTPKTVAENDTAFEEEIKEKKEETPTVAKNDTVQKVLPVCVWCKDSFVPKMAKQKYCGLDCSRLFRNKNRREKKGK